MNNIKLIVFDVDGVLTDGSLYIGSSGEEFKKFNSQDGMGISLAHYAGLKLAIITGRISKSVVQRAKELKINYVYQGVSNKMTVLSQLINELGYEYENVCYIGDDINDLPILKVVGKSFAPSNAIDLVKRSVDIVTMRSGGDGAVREMIDYLLEEKFNLYDLVNSFISSESKVVQ